jgi:hypothetical protein
MTPVTPATPATPAARATAPTNVEADDTFEEIDMKSAPMVELVEFIVTISAAVLKSIQRVRRLLQRSRPVLIIACAARGEDCRQDNDGR